MCFSDMFQFNDADNPDIWTWRLKAYVKSYQAFIVPLVLKDEFPSAS